jgi:hypothetical protein
MLARSALVDAGACLFLLALGTGCASDEPKDGGMGGSSGSGGTPAGDGRYVIEDLEEDCDDVEGLRGAVLLEPQGLTFFGDLSWTDLATGYEASRSPAQIEADITPGGTLTCIPYRHYPGESPVYAQLSYDAASLSMVTEDGLFDESGPAVVWLTETAMAGVLIRQVVRAYPVADVVGTFAVSPVLDDGHETLVQVFSPSEEFPAGYISVATEEPRSVLDAGDASAGVPHGFFPALPE